MNVIHCEAMGICITQAFQAGDYQKIRVVFYRALILKGVISVGNVLFFYYIDVVLLALNFDPEVSGYARDMVLVLSPFLFFCAANYGLTS